MESVRPVVGGPWDGRNASASPEPLVFIDSEGRAWRASAPGRALYRAIEKRWVFVGVNAYRCANCNVFVMQADDGAREARCPLCGHVG